MGRGIRFKQGSFRRSSFPPSCRDFVIRQSVAVGVFSGNLQGFLACVGPIPIHERGRVASDVD